jgi:hypothetical protein
MGKVLWGFLFLSAAATSFAAPVGSIKGYVRDATGAFVPNATITLNSELTGVSAKTRSDSTGLYQFLDLQPGTYTVSAELTGFSTQVIPKVTVLVDQIVSLDFTLSLGEVTEKVFVEGDVRALIEPEKISTGTNFDLKMAANLPEVNRRFNDLAIATPGTTLSAPGTQAGAFAAAGSRAQSTNWMIDGVNALDPQVNGPTNNLRIAEAVQELSVTTTVPSAEFGRQSGAQVNVVTKSGTNDFHGDLFEFFRNDKLQARDFFTNKLSGTKPVLRRNQYGAYIGGPIVRNRTFFLYSWEALQQTNPLPAAAIVPTAAQRASIKDPFAANLVNFYPMPTDPTQPAGRVNYVGNLAQSADDNTHLVRIDQYIGGADRLMGRYIWFGGDTVAAQSPTTLPGFSTLNKPGTQNLAVTETHTFSPTLFIETRAGFSRNKTDFKVEDNGFNAASVLPIPGVVDSTVNPLDSGLPRVVITGYTSLGGATNLPQGRITNTYELFENATRIAGRHAIKFGWSGRREETRRFLDGNSRGSITFNDFDSFAGLCAACNGRSLLLTSTIRTGDTLSHWYRYANALYIQDNMKLKSNLTIELGLRWEPLGVSTEKRLKGTNFIPGVGAVLIGTNQLLDLDPTKTGRSAFVYKTAPFTLPAAGMNPDYKTFGPVVGFAYTPQFGSGWLRDGKTVIRGGFRLSYDDIFNNIPVNQSLNVPFVLTTTQRAGTTQPLAGYGWDLAFNQNIPLVARTTQAPGAPAVGLVTFNGIDPNLRTSYGYNWNFGVQRQIGRSSAVDVSYIGSAGHRLGVFVDANEPNVIVRDPGLRGTQAPNEQVYPFPQWGGTSVAADVGNSTYHGLVIAGKTQLTNILTMNSSYTWSHGIDDSSSFFGATNSNPPDDSHNIRAERGNSDNDQRHRFLNAFVLDVPVGKGRAYLGNAHGIVDQILGGWTLSAITNLTTGVPFTVFSNTNVDFSGFNSTYDRPDVVAPGPLTIDRGNPDNFFDPAYFGKVGTNFCPGSTVNRVTTGCAPAGRVGTSPRNAYYGPGLINVDMAVGKTFGITERFKLEYRADFLNTLNHTNFNVTSNNRSMSSGAFGQLSQTSQFNGGDTGSARVIQMTLKLRF